MIEEIRILINYIESLYLRIEIKFSIEINSGLPSSSRPAYFPRLDPYNELGFGGGRRLVCG